MIKVATTLKAKRWDPVAQLDTLERIALYLEAAFGDGDRSSPPQSATRQRLTA